MFFFFQAEDGIRDVAVTGVQTCALPISPSGPRVAVASAVGVATALGYLLHRSGRPLPTNIRANDAVREGWRARVAAVQAENARRDRKSTRLNSSHGYISYAVFCLKKKKKERVV